MKIGRRKNRQKGQVNAITYRFRYPIGFLRERISFFKRGRGIRILTLNIDSYQLLFLYKNRIQGSIYWSKNQTPLPPPQEDDIFPPSDAPPKFTPRTLLGFTLLLFQ